MDWAESSCCLRNPTYRSLQVESLLVSILIYVYMGEAASYVESFKSARAVGGCCLLCRHNTPLTLPQSDPETLLP